MKRVNLRDPDFTYDPEDPEDPEGFRGIPIGHVPLRPPLAGERLGASVYEIPVGQSLRPFHYEHSEEEWLIVLSGEIVVRGPDGRETFGEWDATCFLPGPAGAHQIRNDSTNEARILMFSNVEHPAVTTYPDSERIGVWTKVDDDSVLVRRSSAVGSYDGEQRSPAEPPPARD